MTDYTNQFSFGFANKLNIFLKLAKNNINIMVSNTFLFKANYTIDKITT